VFPEHARAHENPRSGRAALLGDFGNAVHHFDAGSRRLGTAATIERYGDPGGGLRSVSLRDLGEAVLVEWELGLLLLEGNGQVRWRVEHGWLSKEFPDIGHGAVWYEW
jgi:hypothetical protein